MNKVFFDIEKCYLLILLIWVTSFSLPSIAYTQPDGFTDELIIDGWSQVVGLTFDENGRMYVWEKGGKVWLVENGVKRTTPLIDISEEVANWRDFGLIGFALDPNFLNNGYIYLWYVVDRHHLLHFGTPTYDPNASSEKEATIARLTRYTANPDDNFTSILSNSRKILIGETKSTGPPILHESHGAGHLVFGTDGTLMVSVGDGASYAHPVDEGSHPSTYYEQALADGIITPEQNIGAYRCQTLDNLSGKILRIDPNTGDGVPSNPFYQTHAPRSPQSRTWSLGIRNPYRITLKPESGSHNASDGNPGVFLFGDVGWSTWEDLNIIDAPAQNFGWPMYEGINQKAGYNNPTYQINDTEHTRPKVDWRHGADQARAFVNNKMVSIGNGGVEGKQFRGNSSTGGVWYVRKDFPPAYQNTYFHADYSGGWIRNFGFDVANNPTFVKDFKLNAGAVVFLNTSPVDNGLFYVRYPNQIRRIVYTGYANKKPIAVLHADKTYGASPLTVNFDASQSFDPEYDQLSFFWDFGDNATSTEAKPSVIFETLSAAPTTYDVKLFVTDKHGATAEKIIPISLNNTPPIIVSTSIDDVSIFDAKAGVSLDLSAIVTDKEHNGQLKFEWQTFLFHDGHSHAEPIDNNPTTQTTLSSLECDGSTYWYRITLKVTDPEGLSATFEKDIFPDCVGLPQTINLPSIPNHPLTAGDIVLHATATSGLPISIYLLEGPAIIFGNKIIPNGLPGKVTIRATQGGNEAYQPAHPIEQSFQIVLPSEANCHSEGFINQQVWHDGSYADFTQIPVHTTPNASNRLSDFAAQSTTNRSGAQSINGFICPPQTGLYTFWIASEQHSQLWLSSNANVKNKRLIANVKGTTRRNQWNKYASQQSEPILLVAGNQYYIESITKGNGHVSVGWKMPDNSLNRPISGQYLSPFKERLDQVITFFGIPDKLSTDAAFTIGAAASSGLAVDFSVVSGPATISGSTLTLTGEEGTVVVQASQNGNEQYKAALSVERRFEVIAPPTVPSIIINQPINGSTFTDKNLDIQYTLSGNLDFHEADHLLVGVDNQAVIDVHNLNGIYSLKNLSEGLHTIKMQLANRQHQPFTNPEATAIVSFTIIPTEKTQAITFPTIANKKTTDAPFVINARASSGLPVNLTIVSGPATLNGATITLSGVEGGVTIKASQTGNEEFKPAADVYRSFSVSAPVIEQQQQTITFPPIANKKNTAAPFDVVASASSGLPVRMAIESGPASIDGKRITLTGETGTVIVRASQAGDDNYLSAPDYSRAFIVLQATKENQLITFPSITDKVTTDAAFSLNARASSGLPIHFTVIEGPATINGNEVTLTGTAGRVTIRASQAGNERFLPAPNVDRPFEVKAPIVLPGEEEVVSISNDYCAVKSDFPWQEWIGQITFNEIDNKSTKHIYKLYETPSTSVEKSKTYALKVVPAFSWTQWEEYVRVWVDFNQDGDFSDEGEKVLEAKQAAGIPQQLVNGVATDVQIPASATTGQTRMRIAMQRGKYANECGTVEQGAVEDYLITIEEGVVEDVIVEKQQQTITFSPISDQLTTTKSITLAATASSGLPVTYRILSGAATVEGDILKLNEEVGTIVVSAMQNGNEYYHPAQTMNRAFKVVAPADEIPVISTDYCEAKGQSPWQQWIGNVSFGTIDNTSHKEGYGDFTDKKTTVGKGNSYTIQVRPAFSWTQWDEYIDAWIDFNQNGSFDDIGEHVLSGISIAGTAQSLSQVVEGTVTIPVDAVTGITRMRVSMQREKQATACTSFELGEVEDYTIEIEASATNREVAVLTFAAYAKSNQSVELEWISGGGKTAKSYQIERSKDNLTFYPIAEILSYADQTTPDFYHSVDNVPLKGTTYYRIKQLNHNGSFKYSNAVTIKRAFGQDECYVFPNPVQDIFHVYLKPFLEKKVHLAIYDTYGKLIKESRTDNLQTPILSFDLGNEENGMYYVYLKVNGRKEIGRKFIINRP